jgi:cytosine/adenosine deaminase-related metal-dependent hydrolase
MPIVFAHSASLTREDALLLRKFDKYISITPESEHHFGNDHQNSWHIQEQAALGVDTHSAFSSDIVTQARLWLQTTRLMEYRKVLDRWQVPDSCPMRVNQAFLLVTRNGGLALKRPDLGVIAPGAKADIVVFKGDSPNMIGWVDPVAAVILHSNVGDVEHVLVNGQFKKRDGRLVGVNWEEVKANFLKSTRSIQTVLNKNLEPELAGNYSRIPLPGVEYGKVEKVGVTKGDNNGYGHVFL